MTKRKNYIYLAIVAVVLLSVFIKQRIIIRARERKIVSSFSEWEEHGKPVVVHTVQKRDVPSYTKVTFWQIGPSVFEAHVSKAVRDQLRIGQEMLFKVDGRTAQGVIATIADEISLETGMYPVSTKFDGTFDIPGWHVAYAHTGTMHDVINVPNEIIEKTDDMFFIWKIVDGYAVKQPVTITQRNGYGAIIGSGIDENDRIVIEGFTQLREGDTVNSMQEQDEETQHD